MLKELRDLLEGERIRTWTVCLVILKEVDLDKYRATIQPKTKVYNSSTDKYVELPEIKDCPILTLRGANNSIVCAPSVGDVGIGVFSYMPLDGQLDDDQMAEEELKRRQAYADAFVFIGLLLDDEELPGIKENEIAILHTDKEGESGKYQKILFKPNGDITITAEQGTSIDINFSTGNINITSALATTVNAGGAVAINALGAVTLTAALNVLINAGLKVKIQGSGPAIARVGDPVSVNILTGQGSITGGSSKANCG